MFVHIQTLTKGHAFVSNTYIYDWRHPSHREELQIPLTQEEIGCPCIFMTVQNESECIVSAVYEVAYQGGSSHEGIKENSYTG